MSVTKHVRVSNEAYIVSALYVAFESFESSIGYLSLDLICEMNTNRMNSIIFGFKLIQKCSLISLQDSGLVAKLRHPRDPALALSSPCDPDMCMHM